MQRSYFKIYEAGFLDISCWRTTSKLQRSERTKQAGKMTGVKSVFSDREQEFMKSSIGLELSDTKDYTDDKLTELYDRITEDLPYESDAEGYPPESGS